METLRILMVDDDADDRIIFGRMLRQSSDSPIEFLKAANGSEAEAIIFERHDLDIILLDYQMPGLSGIELLRQWTAAYPELPAVIILTGHGGEDVANEAREAGAFEYLNKNDRCPEELALAVRYAAHVTQMRREMAQLQAMRCEAEAEMRRAQSASGELDGVHRAVATILHEINSPLTGIMNYQRILLDENPPEDMREIYQEVLDASRQIARVMHRIENLDELHARPGASPLGPLDLRRRSA